MINNPNVLLKLVKEKVKKEMEKEIETFGVFIGEFDINDLLKERRLYDNIYDEFCLKNIIYQKIIQSKVEDYSFQNVLGITVFDFPIETFNLMLDDDVDILDTIWFDGVYVDSILDKPFELNYEFLSIFEKCIIKDKWKTKDRKEVII